MARCEKAKVTKIGQLKDRFDLLAALRGRVGPPLEPPARHKIVRLKPQGLAQIFVYHYELYLHLVRQNVLDVHAHGLPGAQGRICLGQTGKIRRYLDKNTVILNAAHNADHRFPGGKAGGVLAPGAQKLPQGQDDAPLCIAVLDGAQKLLAYLRQCG